MFIIVYQSESLSPLRNDFITNFVDKVSQLEKFSAVRGVVVQNIEYVPRFSECSITNIVTSSTTTIIIIINTTTSNNNTTVTTIEILTTGYLNFDNRQII